MSEALERVLVVPTELFRRLGYFQGFCREVDRYLGELFARQHISYRPARRGGAGPGLQAVDPLRDFPPPRAGGPRTVLQYTRGDGHGRGPPAPQAERGHRRPHLGRATPPADGGNPYEEGMRRELDEEVAIDTPYTARCVGLINDDQTEVGRVHLGVVHMFDVERPAVRPRETRDHRVRLSPGGGNPGRHERASRPGRRSA